MTAQQLLENPSISYRVLLEITAGMRLQAFTATPTYSNTFQIAVAQSVVSVRFNLTTELTEQTSIEDVDDNDGSYFHDSGVLYVSAPTGETVFGDNVVQAIIEFLISNKDGVLGGRYYDGRLVSAPVVSSRIEEKFGEVNQIGGGDVSLNNADKYFSPLAGIEWKAGRVVVKVGGDLPPNNVVAYADYETVASWLIQDWDTNDKTFSLKLTEVKGGISDVKIPTAILDRTNYPVLPNDSVGKYIPIVYGKVFSVKPILIDAITRRFKVAGHRIKSFNAVKIKSDTIWNETSFASIDLVNAEFTLGAQWDGQAEVCVDVSGKTDVAGILIENAADIILDILDTIGETNINFDSFNLARARTETGYNDDGRTILRKFSIFISEQRSFIDIVGDINRQCFSYFYSDQNGEYYFGVFEPGRGEGLTRFEDLDISGWSEETETLQNGNPLLSKVVANYQERTEEQYTQVVTRENPANQFAFGVNSPVVSTNDLNFWDLKDAIYFAERSLVTDGRLHKRFRFTVAWRGAFVRAGQLIFVSYARQGVSGVFEVYDSKFDLSSGRVTLIAGDFRGFKDQTGFWVADGATLPTRFAGLSGYGTGDATEWNINWAPEIKAWARQNVGYWTDDNGFADSDDPDSFLASVWF